MFAWAFVGVVLATQTEMLHHRRDWQWQEGRSHDTIVIKFRADAGLLYSNGKLQGNIPPEWQTWIQEIEPMFPNIESMPISNKRVGLQRYVYLQSDAVDIVAQSLVDSPYIEHVYREYLPQPPPADIPPTTPDFFAEQIDVEELQFLYAWNWNQGEGIRIVDVEYSWQPLHEEFADTPNLPTEHAWGWNVDMYQYHGNAVLGQLVAPDNGYGVQGYVRAAEVLMVAPYADVNAYSVAAAIVNSIPLLAEGDIVLLEQQSFDFGAYCPMERNPSVFDAIEYATELGIVVVEPSGNGAQDLDAGYWEGWFDRTTHDSGAIMVGGGAIDGPFSTARTWSGGSSYGSRIDVQGWYDHIATVGAAEMSDLFYPNRDPLQAYTAYFGGTSGASPQIVAMATMLQSMQVESGVAPFRPKELRLLLSRFALEQPSTDVFRIGGQPDIQSLLWLWGL